MIKILNQSFKLLAILHNVELPLISEEINSSYTLDFTTVIDTEKSPYINYQNLIEVEGNYFNIVYYKKNRNSDDTTTIEVQCEHKSYDLLEGDNSLEEGFTAYGTPRAIMTQLFQGTPFTVGTSEITTQEYISVNEATNKREVMLLIAKTFGGELKYNKLQVSLLIRRGADRGVQFRYRKNLLGCSYIVDNRKKVNSLPTISVDVDVAELEFANDGMPDEHYELGDTVTVIDPDLGVNIPARIVKESHNPVERMKGNVNISNVVEDISNIITQIQQKTVYKENVYNGCKIGPENGFEAIRSDKLVRSILNATLGIAVQKGDGSGSNWESKFFVDESGNQHMKDAYIELDSGDNKILIDPNIGIKILKNAVKIFFLDSNGNIRMKDAFIEMTTSDGKYKIIINPTDGIKIQYYNDTEWITVFEALNNGVLKLSEGIVLGDPTSLSSKSIEFYNNGGSDICKIELDSSTGGLFIFNWKDIDIQTTQKLCINAVGLFEVYGDGVDINAWDQSNINLNTAGNINLNATTYIENNLAATLQDIDNVKTWVTDNFVHK